MSSLSKSIRLRSSDDEIFELDEVAALQSETIKHMIEDGCADTIIPLPNVTSKILSKVIDYCKKYVETPKPDDQEALKAYDTDFVEMDQATLFDIIRAANYLHIKSLLQLTCQTVANMVRFKSIQEIRKLFNLKNDFTPEQEAEVLKENAWAFNQ